MQGAINGFLHLYTGQGAIAVGSISALYETDYVVSHYHDPGHALAKTMDSNLTMAELCVKATGSSGGSADSMHVFGRGQTFFEVSYVIVGPQMPVAMGLVLAISYRKGDHVVTS